MSLRGPGPRTIVRARPRCVESCALHAVVRGACVVGPVLVALYFFPGVGV